MIHRDCAILVPLVRTSTRLQTSGMLVSISVSTKNLLQPSLKHIPQCIRLHSIRDEMLCFPTNCVSASFNRYWDHVRTGRQDFDSLLGKIGLICFFTRFQTDSEVKPVSYPLTSDSSCPGGINVWRQSQKRTSDCFRDYKYMEFYLQSIKSRGVHLSNRATLLSQQYNA